MIHVPRTPKPAILKSKGAAWERGILSAKSKASRERAQQKYRHPKIREALVSMFHGKCAYCESRIVHIDYPHIEHFRPKSKPHFRRLAVRWENLLLACGICNGPENKGSKFPTAARCGPAIDPSQENPSDHLKFEYDPATGMANVLMKTPRGDTTIRLFGLDRHELVKHRSSFVKKLIIIADRYKTDPAARQLIDDSVKVPEEYLAFATRIRDKAII